MAKFNVWCNSSTQKVKEHQLHILERDKSKLNAGIDATAEKVPFHYASEERLEQLLKKLGKIKAAKFLKQKLPVKKNIRSGDLGEILCANYVEEYTKFKNGINRLQWKDHRDMAMRGDDIIAIQPVSTPEKIRFLKGEVKSNASLSTSTILEARKALKRNKGLPSPHALSFLADRLREKGKEKLADLIDEAQLEIGIKASQVSHLIFAFCGNNPQNFLNSDLTSYAGKITQNSVGLRVAEHQDFIKRVYSKVIANASKR